MLNLLRDWLLQQGLGGQTVTFVTTAIEIAFVITLAAIADIVARRIIVRQLEKFAGQTSTVWDDIIVKRRVFHRLLHLAPALVIYVFAQPVLDGYDLWIVVVRRASLIYMLLVTLLAIDGALNAGVDILQSSKASRGLPIKPGFPICLPQMAPLYTREPPSARNSVRRTIVQLQRPSPQPTLTWNRPEPLLSGHFSDTAPHLCPFFASLRCTRPRVSLPAPAAPRSSAASRRRVAGSDDLPPAGASSTAHASPAGLQFSPTAAGDS